MRPTDAPDLEQFCLELESSARQARTLAELCFSIANDSYPLLGYRQALVFEGDGDARLLTVSGLANPTEDSPYLVWLRGLWPWLHPRLGEQAGWFEPDRAADPMPPEVEDGWNEWWPAGVLALPLRRRDGSPLGWACFLLDAPPGEVRCAALLRLAQTWAYCWEMLAGRPKPSPLRRWRELTGKQRQAVAVALACLALLPVRLTSLAPAEIAAQNATSVAAPLDGVVTAIHVRPNQSVRQGEPLFSLDSTTLRNRLDVARQSVAVAEAELMSTTVKSFESAQSRGDLAMLEGRAMERRAELAAAQAQLERIDVTAQHDGVAVFGDPDDWQGRPVVTGERIMLLADPTRPGILIHQPVADAIALEPGARVKLFLTVQPLSSLWGTITETSYQATLSPEGVACYRLRAQLDDPDEQPRIGLRGTAKLYGGWAPLGYVMLRRPLAALREWTGL